MAFMEPAEFERPEGDVPDAIVDFFQAHILPGADDGDIEVQAVAQALGIHPFMLSRWKKEYREGKLQGEAHVGLKEVQDMGVAVAEQTRIRALEAALKKARIENDLLKKRSSSIWSEVGPVRVHRSAPRCVRDQVPLPALRGLDERLLRLATPSAEGEARDVDYLDYH